MATSPFSYVPEAQRYLREGVEGFGQQLRPGLLRDIGTTLGGLNQIGALRSGAVPVALGDIAERYGNQVGAFAKQATMGGLESGLSARRQAFAEEEAKRRRKAALLGSIGKVLGAGIGFFAAGPGGAAAGWNAGDALSGAGASDATYDGNYA